MRAGRRRVPLTLDALRARREEILKLAAERGARNVRVFGSVARGDADPKSDIDFLVEMEEGRSLFDMGGLLTDLKELLGRDVDLVSDRGVNRHMQERIFAEAVPL